MGVDVLVAGLGSTAGLRASEDELVAALQRAGATVALARPDAPAQVRTFALTDYVWARAARAAALRGIAEHGPRAVVYSTVTAALFWPRPGAIRYDAPAAANRPGRHGFWQRPLERRRLREATLLVPVAEGTLAETPAPRADAVVVPIPVEASDVPAAAAGAARDIAALAYAADPRKKNVAVVLAAWRAARREGEELVVTGTDGVTAEGLRFAGRVSAAEHRALLRRARVVVNAAVREDYGIVQLEALAEGCALVTAASPGPYAALPLARALDPRLVVDKPHDVPGLAHAIRTALDDPSPGYAERARELLAPFSRAAVDRVVRDELLPRLLG
jgi:glycosyltransferase involved in cell wall biosynthesis